MEEELHMLYDGIKFKYSLPDKLKRQQIEAIVALMNGNVFCVLPTGYGKSLLYCLPPLLLDKVCSFILH